MEAWDQAEVRHQRGDCQRASSDLVAEWLELREASAALVRGLRDEDLAHGGRHTVVGDVTVGELLQEWVYHDRDHLRQILANVQAAVWPRMGATRRFYQPS